MFHNAAIDVRYWFDRVFAGVECFPLGKVSDSVNRLRVMLNSIPSISTAGEVIHEVS
jgi:hypothetical protein